VLGIRSIHDFEEQIRIACFFESRPERGEEVLRHLANEADGVRQDDVVTARQTKSSRARVERREEFVLR
jgi:hypothetical protein